MDLRSSPDTDPGRPEWVTDTLIGAGAAVAVKQAIEVTDGLHQFGLVEIRSRPRFAQSLVYCFDPDLRCRTPHGNLTCGTERYQDYAGQIAQARAAHTNGHGTIDDPAAAAVIADIASQVDITQTDTREQP